MIENGIRNFRVARLVTLGVVLSFLLSCSQNDLTVIVAIDEHVKAEHLLIEICEREVTAHEISDGLVEFRTNISCGDSVLKLLFREESSIASFDLQYVTSGFKKTTIYVTFDGIEASVKQFDAE